MEKKIVGRSLVHSCHVRNTYDKGDAVVIHEQLYYDDGSVEPNLREIRNPKRSFYITKPQFRNHTDKKERAHISELDQHFCANHELEREVFKALNGYYPKGYVRREEILSSPYVYGLGSDIQSLIKTRMVKDFAQTGLVQAPATTGFYDMERSLLEGNKDELTILSYTHENNVYTAILDSAFYKWEDGKRVKGDINELKKKSAEVLDPVIDGLFSSNKTLRTMRDKLPINFYYYVGRTELDLVQWIFSKIHENKTAFIGVWNIDYDIPATIEILENNEVPLQDVFCPPQLAVDLKSAKYARDNRQAAHLTDKWHWMYTTGFSQFYDATSLYAKLRTVKGKEPSYKLDAILKSNGIVGKLHFPGLVETAVSGSPDWHREMSVKHFYEYIIYNQFDVLSLQFLEWQNRDVQSMMLLSDMTPVAKYPRQTVKVQDTLAADWIDQGWILGTPSGDMTEDYDEEIDADGGAVLSALRMDQSGLFAIKECPRLRTQLHCFVNDVDFSGMYPNTAQAANISKETKVSTALYIVSETVQKYYTPQDAVEAFFGMLSCLEANAYHIGKEFFSFPTFDNLEERFGQQFMGGG